MFGSYRFEAWEQGELCPKEEGLFYADGPPERDPDGFAVLANYAESRNIKLRSRREFVDKVLWPIGHQAQGMKPELVRKTATGLG